jgi:hypothetical protein
LANGRGIMSFAHGERHLAITSAIMMGKRHDNLFGHICIYRRTRKHRRIITTKKGWKLVCILWKDGTTSWEPLSDLKEAYPIQTADA